MGRHSTTPQAGQRPRPRGYPSQRPPRPVASSLPAKGTRDVSRKGNKRLGELVQTYDPAPTCLFPLHVWVIAAFFGAITYIAHTKIGQPDDLAAWWVAAKLIDGDQAHALYSIDPKDFALYTGPEWAHYAKEIKDIAPFAHPFVHMPIIAYVLAPVTNIMNFAAFAGIAAVINGMCYALLVAGAISLWTRKAVSPAILIAGTTALWVSSAGQMSIQLGQTSPFIFALIAVSLALSQRRPFVAGVLITVAAVIKVTPVAIIVGMILFASRRKTGLIALALTVVSYLVSWWWAGADTMRQWRETVAWTNSKVLFSPVNSSLDSLFLGPRDLSAIVEIVNETSFEAIAVKIGILSILALCLFLIVGAKSDYSFEIAAVTVLLAGTALSGVVWVHYGLLAILPITGAMILHRSWFAAGICLLMFPPFGAIYVNSDTTPLSQAWATFAVLIVPTIILIVVEVWGKAITWKDLGDGIRGEIMGWKKNEAYPATMSWGKPRGDELPRQSYRVPDIVQRSR